MSLNTEDNIAIQVYADILNKNIGKTLFIEYFENNNRLKFFKKLQTIEYK